MNSEKERNENDTVDVDLTQWELAVQMHMDKVRHFPQESLWPRDVLFKYYQAGGFTEIYQYYQ